MMNHIFQTRTAPPRFNVDMTRSWAMEALEFISGELKHSGHHIHLVCGSSALTCLLFEAAPTLRSISTMFVSELSPKASECLARSVKRATKKFGLGVDWFTTSLETTIPLHLRDLVVYRSLLQNDVVFSSEGLTIVSIDHTYALKAQLSKHLYHHTTPLTEPVQLLRRIVYISRGRPLTRGYIRRCYPEVEVADSMLLRVNAEYEAEFQSRGVVGVHDEALGWRRFGLTPSAEMEEYREELLAMLERENAESYYFSDEKDLPEIPLGGRCSEVANIFSGSKHLFAAFSQ